MSSLRLGVIAGPHLALERVEDTGWHNPFRLADAHPPSGRWAFDPDAGRWSASS